MVREAPLESFASCLSTRQTSEFYTNIFPKEDGNKLKPKLDVSMLSSFACRVFICIAEHEAADDAI